MRTAEAHQGHSFTPPSPGLLCAFIEYESCRVESGMQRGMEFRSLATSLLSILASAYPARAFGMCYFERRYLLMYDLLFRNPGFLSQKRGFLRDQLPISLRDGLV
jgi:hypothetical protein